MTEERQEKWGGKNIAREGIKRKREGSRLVIGGQKRESCGKKEGM